MSYSHHHQQLNRPPIVVHDHDVLSGRGVNIAQHPGNQRYRTLISTRKDADYCEKYTTTEKRAVAEEIIKHIHSLDPPGRFLKREGGGRSNRGLSGPWDVLNHDACVKKVCQALRDCNRQDRSGYADGVPKPTDVVVAHEKRKQSGLTPKQQAAAAAGAVAAHMAALDDARFGTIGGLGGMHAGMPPTGPDADQLAAAAAMNCGRVSPTMAEAAHTLYAKRQRTDDGHVPVQPVPHDAYHHHAAAAAAAAAAAPVPVDHTHVHVYPHPHTGAGVNGEAAAAAAASWANHGQGDVPVPAPAHAYPPPIDNITGGDEQEDHTDQLNIEAL